jgi:lipoprotein-anchoring transpeptidase ErfK/SrfK
MRFHYCLLVLVLVLSGPKKAQSEAIITPTAVENATLEEAHGAEPNAGLVRTQILLDRLRFSPGVIDGTRNPNTRLAVQAFQQANGLAPTGELDQTTWDSLTRSQSAPLLQDYQITEEDVGGSFVNIPKEMEQQAILEKLGYSSIRESLAEKFHLDEKILLALNRGRSLDQAGTRVSVPIVRAGRLGQVARVKVEQHGVRAYGKDGQLLAIYPATVGSEVRPAPSGSFKVTEIVENPIYTYHPKNRIEGVEADTPFNVAPGPNNPVGVVWIEINKDGFGLHGTPDPSEINKTASHGCVRLTNWDAEDLARGLSRGVPVEFTRR